MNLKTTGSSSLQNVELAGKRTRSKLSGKISASGGNPKLSAYASNSLGQAPKIIQKKIKLGQGGRKSETSQDSMKNREINSIRSQ